MYDGTVYLPLVCCEGVEKSLDKIKADIGEIGFDVFVEVGRGRWACSV
jgi:hypothetical protein